MFESAHVTSEGQPSHTTFSVDLSVHREILLPYNGDESKIDTLWSCLGPIKAHGIIFMMKNTRARPSLHICVCILYCIYEQ